jgi:hypothetical protein
MHAPSVENPFLSRHHHLSRVCHPVVHRAVSKSWEEDLSKQGRCHDNATMAINPHSAMSSIWLPGSNAIGLKKLNTGEKRRQVIHTPGAHDTARPPSTAHPTYNLVAQLEAATQLAVVQLTIAVPLVGVIASESMQG